MKPKGVERQITLPPPQQARSSFVERVLGAMQGWMNPGNPIQPSAPAGTSVRQFDYPVAVNLNFLPRKNESVTFQQMRNLADGSYLIRIIIEKVKDRIAAKPWHLKLKSKPGEADAATRERSANDPRIQKLTELFAIPDGEHTWQKWIRAILEDMIVIDAPAIYLQRNRGGEIIRLIATDGATINRIIKLDGTTPQPEDGPAYQQIIKGIPSCDLALNELLYVPRNFRTHKLFGYGPVEQLIVLLNTQILRSIYQMNVYDKGNLPAAIGYLPTEWSSDEQVRFAKEFEATLNGNLDERVRVFWMPETQRGLEPLKMEEIFGKSEEWLARCFCWAIGETPTGFVQMMNRASGQQQDDTREEAGEQPLLAEIVDNINVLLQSPLYFNEPEIEFAWTDVTNPNALEQAQIDQINVLIKTRTPNELRARDGYAPLEDEEEEEGIDESNEDAQDPEGNEPKPPEPGKTALVKKKTVVHATISPVTDTPAKRKATANIQTYLTSYFTSEGKRIAEEISKAYESHAPKKAAKSQPDYSQPIDDVMRSLNLDSWADIIDEIVKELEDAGDDGIALILKQLDVEVTSDVFDVIHEAALEYAKDRSAELVGRKWLDGKLVDNPDAKWAITETTRNDIHDMVVHAFENGSSPAELARDIREAATFSKSRAEMIADTEVAMASVNASLETAKETGATLKKVLLSNDHDIDDVCDLAEAAGAVPISHVYENGALFVPLHPNCQCDLITLKEGEE